MNQTKTSIGRKSAAKAALLVDHDTVSSIHAYLYIYDYENRRYFLQHGNGSNLTYCNGTVVFQPLEIRQGDLIKLGDTKLKFIPFCDEKCEWEI